MKFLELIANHILYNVAEKNVLPCFVEIVNFSGVHLALNIGKLHKRNALEHNVCTL